MRTGVLAATLVWTSLSCAADPAAELPPPTGPFPIGRTTHFWTDESRPEPGTEDSDDRRRLRVELWYPAAKAEENPAPYVADLRALGIRASLFRFTRTHAREQAGVAATPDRFPVVLLTPGAGSNAFQYTSLAEELVSHGYVVAAVDHPFQSWVIVYPEGSQARQAPPPQEALADPERSFDHYRRNVEQRVADLRFALDRLAQLDQGQDGSPLAGRLDLERVCVMGHSVGGVAAAETCRTDARFKSAVNLDGHARSLPFFLDAAGRGPRQPILELTDGQARPSDEQLAERGISRDAFERQQAETAQRIDHAMRSVEGGSYRVTIPGMRHEHFSDMALWDESTPGEQRRRRIQILRDYTRAFFDKTLRGQEATTLFDAPQSAYAEVTVERFEPAAGQ